MNRIKQRSSPIWSLRFNGEGFLAWPMVPARGRLPRLSVGSASAGANQRIKLTGAAILVSRGMKVLQAAPAAYPYRSATRGRTRMTPKQAIAFVKANGIVLESGRGPVPNLAEAIAGAPIRGSWWAHPKANTIFLCTGAIRKSADVLVCRLVCGKVTYVYRHFWPALVRLARRFDADRLAAIEEVH